MTQSLDRRRENRRMTQVKATLTVLDGPLGGSSYEVLTRDVSHDGLSFMLRDPLTIGQTCRLDLPASGRNASWLCEVVRSRPLSTGRHEMAIQYRKAV